MNVAWEFLILLAHMINNSSDGKKYMQIKTDI